MVVVLDTSVLIDIFRGNKKTLEELKKYKEEIFAITSITLFELWQGKLKEVEKFVLDNLPKYPFDEKSAKLAGIILKELKEIGKIPEIQDLLIASICIANNSKLITKDKGFEVFKPFRLRVEIIR